MTKTFKTQIRLQDLIDDTSGASSSPIVAISDRLLVFNVPRSMRVIYEQKVNLFILCL